MIVPISYEGSHEEEVKMVPQNGSKNYNFNNFNAVNDSDSDVKEEEEDKMFLSQKLVVSFK